MSELRNRIIRLAAAKPELRADLLPLLKEESDPASHDQNKPESYYFGKTANDSFEIRWRVEGGAWQVKRFRNGREYEMWVDKMYENKVPFEVDADSVEGHSEEYLRSLLASGLPPRGVQASTTRTAGRVSVRIEHGAVTVEDIEGTSPFGRVGQVAYLDAGKSGKAATRAAISVVSAFREAMERMSSGGEAIGFVERKVFEGTGKVLRLQYIQLPM